MRNFEQKIEEIKATQVELDHRTSVEKEAEKLIGQCRFEEAEELLDALDSGEKQQ